MTYVVYSLRHLRSGQLYIGATKNLRKRLVDHVYKSRLKCSPGSLQKLIAVDGLDSFQLEVLRTCLDAEDLRVAESQLIDEFNPALNRCKTHSYLVSRWKKSPEFLNA